MTNRPSTFGVGPSGPAPFFVPSSNPDMAPDPLRGYHYPPREAPAKSGRRRSPAQTGVYIYVYAYVMSGTREGALVQECAGKGLAPYCPHTDGYSRISTIEQSKYKTEGKYRHHPYEKDRYSTSTGKDRFIQRLFDCALFPKDLHRTAAFAQTFFAQSPHLCTIRPQPKGKPQRGQGKNPHNKNPEKYLT